MTTTTASETVTALTAALRDGIRHLRGREPRLINEAATLSVIIRPTLEALGYPATHRIPEYGGQRNRLDESCFLHPVGSAPGYATLIVEAKQIGADFDRAAPSQGRSTSPDRQIQRYLKQHAASGPSTLGVLTDGVKWRIYRRAGSPANPDVELLVEHNFTALVEGGQQALDAENRARWFDAHTEDAKQQVLTRDTQLRDRLNWLLQGNADLANPELLGFAEAELLSNDPVPTRTDVRLLFYENPWRGFDIVIGNPPYTGIDQPARTKLAREKLYRVTNISNTYPLFCETALSLANPSGGVVTMIVPLSIAFGQRLRSLREILENQSCKITLRHYDNRPDTIFNASPTVQNQENRQRATIITAVAGKGNAVVETTGLQRWPAAERMRCIAHRSATIAANLGNNVDPRVANQWLRIPTPEVAEMVAAIARQSHTVISLAYSGDDGELLAFPQTAYQFIGVVPGGTVSPRRETTITVRDMDVLRLAMATLNGHVGYAWWWMVGDGFHVKPVADHGTLAIPNAWSKNPQPAIELGQLLSDAIPECIVETPNRGTVWRNVNFHLKPDLIEELDRLHLSALEFTGPAQDTLLGQLRIMRSSSSWDFSDAAIATQLGRSR